MKVLAPTILFTAVLASAATASPDFQGQEIQKRQGLFDNIQDSFNDAINNAGNLFNIGHAGEDSTTEGEDNATTSNTSATTTPTRSSPASSTDEQASTTSNTSSSEAASSDPATSDDSTEKSSKDDDNEKTSKEETTKTTDDNTDDAKPTGDPCSNDGDKQCVNSGSSSAYKLCQDGFWVDQKCGNSDVCGTDSLGAIACINKDTPVVQLESCSKKNQQRCDSGDTTKYQICDGKHWQTYGCDSNNQCSMSNKKAVCASKDSGSNGNAGDGSSYSPITQAAFVPESSANIRAAIAGSVMALVVAAGLLC
ncbi:hypothetical protein LPJ57_003383 [Coemansia sp. RSA 486]|nr:hypothetical protein LPJ57_003383 [Coemansia sp. RSA 486]KAJ2233862.1 hypothetical protein IWW45_003867 [Coemansia sp. RSA 485]